MWFYMATTIRYLNMKNRPEIGRNFVLQSGWNGLSEFDKGQIILIGLAQKQANFKVWSTWKQLFELHCRTANPRCPALQLSRDTPCLMKNCPRDGFGPDDEETVSMTVHWVATDCALCSSQISWDFACCSSCVQACQLATYNDFNKR